MIKTDYIIDGERIGYEATENGYIIYLGENKWIAQEGFIPHIRNTMEESALAHIQKIVEDAESSNKSCADDTVSKNEFIEMQQDITDMDLRLIALEG